MTASAESLFLNICAALGGYEPVADGDSTQPKERYVLGDECLDCLRDIKQYLLRDDRTEGKPLLRRIGEMRILTLDLLPILLATYEGKTEDQDLICGTCLELLVPLTWPPEATLPWLTERKQQLWSYKYAFMQEQALPALFTILVGWLAIPYVERSGRRQALIRLLLTLVRNLLAIEDPCTPTNASADTLKYARMHADLVKALHRTSFVRLCLVMASSVASQEYAAWNLLLLEIVQLLFAQTTPSRLVSEAIDTRMVGMQTDSLVKELSKEERVRKDRQRHAPSRHSRFGGAISEKLADGTHYNILKQFTPHLSFHSAIEPMKKPKTATAKQWTFDQKQYPLDKELSKLLYRTAETIVCSCFNRRCSMPMYIRAHGFTYGPSAMVASVRHTIDVGRPDMLNDDANRFFAFTAFFLEFQLTVMSNEAASLHAELAYPVNAFHQVVSGTAVHAPSCNC
ncbi:timeless protein-domain-containing protein [Syncephalis pseudoplumigaleata]|uniref:Timeless protein-domain-containing protein n=1 Tax=Syncephalis pseudoplumigaleata TaxID=1712513 RepID=A0A4P9Z0H4_9FUNG|nr:timeless protein-domain-containing protein [Syncephalis pseudoplumigaleata]|eukprot:RKP25957.1 timeless protein-domain-containing protein [Syncephalis pseudoplumigaleata]